MANSELSIYSKEDLSMEAYLHLYGKEILSGVRCSQVESAILSYVTSAIEPTGWQAIWRSVPKSSGLKFVYDFLVEVIDVSQNNLEAIIGILKPLPQFDNMLTVNSIYTAEVNKLGKRCNSVPLVELYPIANEDESRHFEKTAEVVEQVRFFYKNLWRPWDNDDEDDCIFADYYLEPRLKLFYDSGAGVIPSHILDRMQIILNEALENHQQLVAIEKEMNIADSEELSEEHVLKCIQHRLKQDELKKELQLLEIPELRALVTQKELGIRNMPRGIRQNGELVVHIVAAKLMAGMVRDLDPESVIEHHDSFAAAISAAYENDIVWIYPGTYVCEGLGWFEDSIQVIGKASSPDEIILEVKGNTDVFINCNCEKIRLSNFTIRGTNDQYCCLMIHHGQATIENCKISHGQVGICVNSMAEAIVNGCVIEKSQVCSIDVHSGSSLTVHGSTFADSQRFNIAVQFENDPRNQFVEVYDNIIKEDNECASVVIYPTEKKLTEINENHFQELEDVTNRFDWIKAKRNKTCSSRISSDSIWITY